MATVNMPVYGEIKVTPSVVTLGEPFVLSVTVTDSPVTVYPVSNYANEPYSGEVKPAWP